MWPDFFRNKLGPGMSYDLNLSQLWGVVMSRGITLPCFYGAYIPILVAKTVIIFWGASAGLQITSRTCLGMLMDHDGDG